MKATVKAYLYLQKTLGWKELLLDLPGGTSLFELFRLLNHSHGFPDWGAAGSRIRILLEDDKWINLTVLLNGRPPGSLQGLDTILEDGATVTLFPPAAGG